MQGLILINKPKGITSFGAVARVKKITNEKRVGHTGTLDPMATGVLPIFIGKSTQLSDFLLSAEKEYITDVKLGITTDTLDITGNVLSKQEVSFTLEKIKETLDGFLGESMQMPPMYSAIKKDGVRLYQLARKGQTIEREPRKINIKKIDIIRFNKDTFSIKVLCSKGTYIRSLVDDIGKKLGVGATVTDLKRTKTAGFNIEDCVDLDDLTEENIIDFINPEEIAVESYKEIFVSQKQAIRFSNGGELDFERLRFNTYPQENEIFRVKYKNLFLGLGIASHQNLAIKIKCLINQYK